MWQDPAWLAEVHDWIGTQLGQLGRRVTGPIEQPHVRFWATALRIDTDTGPVWFKATGPGIRYEIGLEAALARLAPSSVLRPLAVDVDRGWSLMPDAGTSLWTVMDRDPGLRHWERALPEYAELQRSTADHVDELFAVGVPDHRPDAMPALLSAMLDDTDTVRVGAPGGLFFDAYDALRALERRDFAKWCTRLAGYGVPPTLQHDDLHEGNVFVRDGGYVFFDWGDSCVAHPFSSLMVVLRQCVRRYDLPADDPALCRLQDAYLEAWTAEHDRDALHEACELAMRITPLCRAYAWRRALVGVEPEVSAIHALTTWLSRLLDQPVDR